MQKSARLTKKFLPHSSRGKLFLSIAIVSLFSTLLGFSLFANSAATRYQDEVVGFKQNIVDYNGRDASMVTKEFKHTPRLRSIPFGSIFSPAYRQATITQHLVAYYTGIAHDIDRRVANSKDSFAEKLQSLVMKHRATEKSIISTSKEKEDALSVTPEAIKIGIAPFEKLKAIRTETYKKTVADIRTHIDEATALDASNGMQDGKAYYLSLLQKDRDLNIRYQKQLQSLKSYGALERANNTYPIERQKISDEIVVSVYAASALQADQFSLALSVQYALKDDLGPLSKTTQDGAKQKATIALYSRYARYASSAKFRADSNQINTGATYFGLYMADHALNTATSLDKKLVASLQSDVAEIRGIADILFMGLQSSGLNIRNTGRILDSTQIIVGLGDSSGFQLASLQVGETNKATNVTIDIPETKQYAYKIIDATLPTADSLRTQLNAYRSAAKKCVDVRLAYYQISKDNFKKLNALDDSRKKLSAQLSNNPSEVVQKEVSNRLTTLKSQLTDINNTRRTASIMYNTESASCAQSLEKTESALIDATKQTTLLAQDLYKKLEAMPNSVYK